ncbi:hypothetical protein [Actinoplanes sp. G11-F43]|uniref:hypothetical protein n=1 Tax=Actinoplanes sp. G11-F43 TaxID=3424130 RepID=UPI003D354E42
MFAETAPQLLVADRIPKGTPGYIAEQTGRALGRTKEQLAAGGCQRASGGRPDGGTRVAGAAGASLDPRRRR